MEIITRVSLEQNTSPRSRVPSRKRIRRRSAMSPLWRRLNGYSTRSLGQLSRKKTISDNIVWVIEKLSKKAQIAVDQCYYIRMVQDNSWSPAMVYEPPHIKTNKITVRPAKTQISLGIRPVWLESSMCATWVAKDPSFLHADSEDYDQSGRTSHFVGFVMRRLSYILTKPL